MSLARPPRFFLAGALVAATFGVALAGPLLKLRSPALDPFAVAFWRMLFASSVTGGFWIAARGSARARGGEPPRADRHAPLAPLVAGFFLAIHFATWIASLDRISVAASVVLVDTMPIFVALLSWWWLREALVPLQWTGLGLACAGVAVITFLGGSGASASAASRDPLLGTLLALSGAVSGAVYYVIGRVARRGGTLWGYVTSVYGAAALFLFVFSRIADSSLWPFPLRDGLVLAGLVVGPTLLGHTVLNWSLRWIPAAVANSVTLGEPIVAALLALAFLGEVPVPATAGGGAILLAGIALVVAGRKT